MIPETESKPARARILVVEDEVLTRMACAEALRDAGFFVIEAVHADEALAYLNAGGTVDLVFSDIQMPGSMNGLELARLLHVNYPALPIILTSTSNGPVAPAIFISKPYRMERVISIVFEKLGLENPDA